MKLPNGKIFYLRFRILDSYIDRQTKIKSALFNFKYCSIKKSYAKLIFSERQLNLSTNNFKIRFGKLMFRQGQLTFSSNNFNIRFKNLY